MECHYLVSDSAGGSIPELDWKKCDAVSKIIAHCPRKSTCVEEYYKLIAPQVWHYMDLKMFYQIKVQHLNLCYLIAYYKQYSSFWNTAFYVVSEVFVSF